MKTLQITSGSVLSTQSFCPTSTQSFSNMCNYTDMKQIYKGCSQTPKHVVTDRTYKSCDRPQNIGTYRHCSDEHATPLAAVVFGSTRVSGECPDCKSGTTL
ncbi:hypothetical protein P154DRAFT_522511 [Amniculicola lignicola CBS 123094]|uniref:Uncharacterized protein n=1 Tax=Amniculicola lignicola CBS 123094 TaxID=1392246 RepID=A0A6A5WHW6_9PLEO|nr:hypothetical protein P154DRAFT_522511 [Amniculicola lignicola CBS 123094]